MGHRARVIALLTIVAGLLVLLVASGVGASVRSSRARKGVTLREEWTALNGDT